MKVTIRNSKTLEAKNIEVPNYFSVVGNRLFNNNTKRFEGADGDIVTVCRLGKCYCGHVKGYTNYQIIPTYEWDTFVVSSREIHDDGGVSFNHLNDVELEQWNSSTETE